MICTVQMDTGRPGLLASESSMKLIALAKEGEPRALDELCARYLPRLLRWARGRIPARARAAFDTQDLVQDTLCQVLRHVDRFEPRHEGAFQAYLRQALLNRLRDELRRSQRRPPADPLDTGNPSPDPSPLELAIGQQVLERYEMALSRLRPEDREAIIVRVELRLPYAEAAEALGKPSAAAAHMAVSRALLRLAEAMSREAVARDGQPRVVPSS